MEYGTDQDVARARRTRRWIVIGAVAAVLVVILAVAFVYTEQSSFCNTCHEMKPYYSAWLSGKHAGKAECVDCHVDPGFIGSALHKPQALKEVWDHWFDPQKFPMYRHEIPAKRCTKCHTKIAEPTTYKFSHVKHVKRARCQDCHIVTGHDVSFDALRAENSFNSGVTTPSIAPKNWTPSAAPNHVKVICQECHDQAREQCTDCHF